MKNQIITLLSLFLVLGESPKVLAANADSKQLNPAGKTIMARGKVFAIDGKNNKERRIRRRSEVFNVDNVKTGAKSRAQFSMIDGGLLSVKPNSEIKISEYEFEDGSGEANASIELITGGLRSISGQIKKRGGDFDVKTPVGSIGIRGTHFEVEMVDGELAIAVWDGAIDLTTNNEEGSQMVSFGEGEKFSFGMVSQEGKVTMLLTPPSNFNQGHSSDTTENSDDSENSEQDEEESGDESSEGDDEQEQGNTGTEAEDQPEGDSEDNADSTLNTNIEADGSNFTESASTETSEVDDTVTAAVSETTLYSEQALVTETTNTLAEIISNRQGEFTYSNVRDSSLEASAGGVTNFSMFMTVDFDNGTVPQGEISASDNGGAWYASFSGFINLTDLDLDITFASHGHERADGTIDAVFFDSSDAILGNFDLFEIKNPNNKLTGSFILD